MAGSGTLTQPERGRILDAEYLHRAIMQIVGRDLGLDDWGSKVVHTSFSSATDYAHTIQNQGAGGHLNIPGVLQVQDSGVSSGPLTASSLTVTGAATFNGNVALGNAAGDTITVTGTPTFSATATFNGAVVANANVALGDAAGDTVTVNGTPTFNAASTFKHNVTIQNSALTTLAAFVVTAGAQTATIGAAASPGLFVDVANGRTMVGTATALTSAADDKLTVAGGAAYFAGNSGPSIGLRYNAAQTVGWTVGVSAAGANPDLVFKDDGAVEVFRIGDGAASVQAKVTGTLDVTSDAIARGRLVVAGATFSGAEELRVIGQSRLEGDVTVSSGTVTVSAGNVDVQGGTAGEIRSGKVIVGAASLSGTEELRVVGQTRLEGDTAVTTGALTVPATDPPTANTEVTAGSQCKAWAYVTVSGGAITINDSYNVDTAACTYNAAGDYSIVWDRNFSSATYAVVVTPLDNGAVLLAPKVNGQIAGSADIWIYNATATKTDPDAFMVAAFGTLS